VDFGAPPADATRTRLVTRFGAGAESWWERLPGVVAALAERWTLDVGEPVGRGNTSLVVRCRRADGRGAMLKLTPDPDLAAAEASALAAWSASRRVPELWGTDAAAGALLLEAIPGETQVGRDVPLADVAALIAELHAAPAPGDPASPPGRVAAPGDPAAPPTDLVSPHDGVAAPGDPVSPPDRVAAPGEPVPLGDRVEFVFGHWIARHARGGAIAAVPVARLERGRGLARALVAAAGPRVLLHGDLHPGNVLDGGARGLVAIDPRPCIGDPAFDAVDWVFWGADDPAPGSRAAARSPSDWTPSPTASGAGAPPSRGCSPPPLRPAARAPKPSPGSCRSLRERLHGGHAPPARPALRACLAMATTLAPDLIDQLAAAGRRIVAKRLTWGNAGNLSVRIDAQRFAISATGACLDELSGAAIAICELDGEGWEGERPPSVEAGLHRLVYRRRPETGAVLHTSALHTTLVAASELPLDTSATTDTAHYLRRLARVPFHVPGSPELAAAASAAAAAHDVLLLDNHGALVAAPDVAAAINVTEALELLCAMLVARAQGFPLRPLTPDQVANAAA
jgi:streptomycin 6-kinase